MVQMPAELHIHVLLYHAVCVSQTDTCTDICMYGAWLLF